MYYPLDYMTTLNRLTVKVSVAVLLLLMVTYPIILPRNVAAQNENQQYFEKEFAWNYGGSHWTWNLSIPKALYQAYKDVPVTTRTHNGPSGYGFLTTTNDDYIKILAEKLNETTTGLNYNSYDQVSFVLAFVQSLPYTSDNVTTGHDEYPRFPIETLVDDGGDCEDTSILFATLTLALGYGTVYINPPDHYAVGILGNDISGTSFTYNDKKYYYCETTGNGFKIGQLPDEFSGQSASIYAIDQSTQFIPNVQIQIVEPAPTEASNMLGRTPTPIPTFDPNPSSSPTVPDPTIQPLTPLTRAITDNPALFITIIFAITVSIVVAIKSVQKPKQQSVPNQTGMKEPIQSASANIEGAKFCIYCGSSNQQYAVYCEKCGRQIA